MSRSTQFIGHTKEVTDFLQSCSIIRSVRTVTGMFGEEVAFLSDWLDPSGHIWREFVQYEPWSSGPMIFLGIKNLTTGEIRGWTKVWKAGGVDFEFDYDYGVIYVLL